MLHRSDLSTALGRNSYNQSWKLYMIALLMILAIFCSYGNTTTYNLNTLLYQNILHSDYFRQLLYAQSYPSLRTYDLYYSNLKTYHEIVDEIYYRVDNAGNTSILLYPVITHTPILIEPLCPGTARIPSTCFCLLLKCFTMRLTMRQMQGLLKHTVPLPNPIPSVNQLCANV